MKEPSSLLSVRLTPRSGRDEVSGWADGVLLARVKAPPVDGRANDALCRLLARVLGVPPSSVSIASGATARIKRVRVLGLSEEVALSKLGGG